MQRMSGVDAAFLSTETASMHNHVAGVFIFDFSEVEGGYSFARVKELIRARLPLLPPFRRRAVRVPFGLHHPLWIEDPDFDLDYHVRRACLPPPGSMKELAEFVGDVVARPLDLNKPLWEVYMVEGLEGGAVAQVTKTHHAAIDGVSGAELAAQFLDLTPEGREVPPEDPPWQPDRVPSDLELLGYAVDSLLKSPGELASQAARTVRALLELRRRNREQQGPVPPAPFSAPKTLFNAALTPHRKVAFADVSLEEAKLVKNTFGCKVNDVVLAICATALREYLIEHRALPDEPLVAMVPISVRTEEERGTWGNKVSMMLVSLHTDVDDPIKRLSLIAESSRRAKEQERAIGADVLTNWFEFAAPALAARAARLLSSLKVFDHLRPLFNVTISNVPGPNFQLYGAGAKMVAMYPLGPLVEGVGINITVFSYLGRIFFGIQVCREAVPDVEDLAILLEEGHKDLVKAAERKAKGMEPRARKRVRRPRPGA